MKEMEYLHEIPFKKNEMSILEQAREKHGANNWHDFLLDLVREYLRSREAQR
jgi:hypothetical protein